MFGYTNLGYLFEIPKRLVNERTNPFHDEKAIIIQFNTFVMNVYNVSN